MTWLVDGQVIDVRSGRIERKHIRVDEGRITALSTERPARADRSIVDLAGAYVLPGFFDCHDHVELNTLLARHV